MDIEQFHERLKELYWPPENEFTLVDVPEIRFAVIDGQGNPNGQIADASKWLCALTQEVKPIVKERMGKSFVEPPLECQFWVDDAEDFTLDKKDKWHWRVMHVFIDWITQEHFDDAVAKVEKKLGPAPETLRIERMLEGKSVQTMHVGDYHDIHSVCEKLYSEYLPQNNLKINGCYHEIYLNNPIRTPTEKRRVVIRQPVL